MLSSPYLAKQQNLLRIILLFLEALSQSSANCYFCTFQSIFHDLFNQVVIFAVSTLSNAKNKQKKTCIKMTRMLYFSGSNSTQNSSFWLWGLVFKPCICNLKLGSPVLLYREMSHFCIACCSVTVRMISLLGNSWFIDLKIAFSWK